MVVANNVAVDPLAPVRNLKVVPKVRNGKYRDVRDYPEIKLSGKWLNKFGFHQGRMVTVTMMQEMLVIRLQES